MTLLPVLPVLVPLTTAVLSVALMRRSGWRTAVSVLGAALLLAAGVVLLTTVWQDGTMAVEIGSWPAPFGIVLVADPLSALMVVVTGAMGLAVAIYAIGDINGLNARHGFHAFFHLLLAGVAGGFLTGDLFNLYVWFEVSLIASFALLVCGGNKEQLAGAVKYAVLNLVATTLLLMAIGLLYGQTGTLNMADLSVRVAEVENPALLEAVALLMLLALGIKAALFPVFFWLPASYHTPPVSVTAIFSALLTKFGVYVILRLYSLVFPPEVFSLHPILTVVAVATMVAGVLGAAAQNEIRRILSFHIVSQIGYLILGLALFTPLALLGTVFYMVHNIVAKTALFLVGGIAERETGTSHLSRLGGLYRSRPRLALLFLLPALALAGLPPLSGFWAKFVLLKASLEVGSYGAALAVLAVGAVTLFSMMKIWNEVFWKAAPAEGPAADDTGARPATLAMFGAAAAVAMGTVVLGVWAEPLMTLAERTAGELINPEPYLRAVMGGRP